jgi:hypothetical protein
LAQLLLLFPRSRRKGGLIVGAIAGGAIAAGLILTLPLSAPSELAQALRESAWDRALAEAPEPSAWPWTGAPVATTRKVPRLGLSAAVIRDASGQSMPAIHAPLSPAAAGIPKHDGAMPSELAVGDRIIVTTASGNSRVYRVAGPKVVDPHLLEGGSGARNGAATGDTCVPLDPSLAGPLRLIIEAITADPPAPAPNEEQKL